MSTRGQANGPRITLRDVAERAGVSMSTASLVYSGKKPVREATRERVHAAATELGYRGPDPLAASLRAGRSGVVAVVVPQRLAYAFRDPYSIQLLDGLGEALGELGASMLLLEDDPEGPAAQHAVDAAVFVLCGRDTSLLADRFLERGIPIVATGAPRGPGIVQVEVDERAAQASAVQHLLDLGHRRIAHVTMPLGVDDERVDITWADLQHSIFPDTRARAAGVRELAGETPIACATECDVATGRAAAELLLDTPEPPTAIVAQSDLTAVGCVQAVRDRGLRVPEDVSVTGFDGVELPWFDLPLTTVDQHPQEKGRLVGEVLRRLLDGDRVRRRSAPWELVVGGTTAPPPRV